MSVLGYDLQFYQAFRVSGTIGVVLLFCLVCLEFLVHIGSQIPITFWNHSENCRVHRSDELGLLRNDYGEFSNLCVSPD